MGYTYGMQEKPGEPRAVFTTADPAEARLVQGLLESYGIEAFLFDENICRIDPMVTLAVGGVRVMVEESRAEEAGLVLRDHKFGAGKLAPFGSRGEARKPRAPDEARRIPLHCPDCGADVEPDANFCVACRAVLRPVRLCECCGAADDARAPSCSRCGARAGAPRDPEAGRRRAALGMTLLAVTAGAVAWLIASDIRHGRHALSTKDGRFSQEVKKGNLDR